MYIYIYIYIYEKVHTHVCMHTCIYVQILRSIYIPVSAYVYRYTYIPAEVVHAELVLLRKQSWPYPPARERDRNMEKKSVRYDTIFI